MRRIIAVGLITLVSLVTLASVILLGPKTKATLDSTNAALGGPSVAPLAAMEAPHERGILRAVDGQEVRSPGAPTAAAASRGGGVAEASVPPLDRMVVANVNLTVSVEHAVEAARVAEGIALRYGGFVSGSNIRDADKSREATVTLRIPSPSLPEALAELRGIGRKVTDETRTTQDVTDQYTDVQSSLRNLQATETRLLALMERAGRMEEILTLQRELTNIRGQIERLEGRRRVLENRADLATIVVRLVELPGADLRNGWNPGTTALEALAALSRFGERVGTLVIWGAVFAPVYGIPLLAGWWVLRQRTERQPA